MMTTMEMYMY